MYNNLKRATFLWIIALFFRVPKPFLTAIPTPQRNRLKWNVAGLVEICSSLLESLPQNFHTVDRSWHHRVLL